MQRTLLRLTLFCATLSAHPQKPAPVDRILVNKSAHTMILMSHGQPVKTYHVWIGRGPADAKQERGDNKTPEGIYTINGRNAHSSAHLSLHISYPNAADRERARRLGVDPGGDIMIHGLPPGNDWIKPGQQLPDWTYGCIAVTDSEIEEIWKLVPDGTTIEIRH